MHAAVFRYRCMSVLIALAALLVGLAGNLTQRGLESHEIFVAQTARQMLAANDGHGDWVRPVFNDHARLNKPPLMYWSVMAAAKSLPGAASIAPWVARLPSALASVAMALCTVLLGRMLVNASVGLLAGALAVGSIGWGQYANNARPEMLYAAWSVAMLTCFVAVWKHAASGGQHRSPSDVRTGWGLALAGWLFGGLAILTKGPQVPAVLLLGFAAFAIFEKKWRNLKFLRPQIGLPLMLLVPVPWVFAVLAREPGGWHAWTHDLFEGRAGTPNVHAGEYLDPYYVYALPALLLPWAILLPWGVAQAVARRRPERWGLRLCLWLLIVPIVVMSLTIHRRNYYLLALMPVMGVLIATVAWSWRERARHWLQTPAKQRLAWLLLLVVATGVGAFAGLTSPLVRKDRVARLTTFAQEAAAAASKQIGPNARIVAWQAEPEFLLYARNAVVPAVANEESLLRLLAEGKVDAVLCPPQEWERLATLHGDALPHTRTLVELKGAGKNAADATVLLEVTMGSNPR